MQSKFKSNLMYTFLDLDITPSTPKLLANPV